MKKKFDQVYQFKIMLKNTKPPIWRRIQVPETYSFWDLHVAITDAMGWLDYHLHQFEMINPKKGENVTIGIPSEDDIGYDWEILPGWRQRISDYFSLKNKVADYVYDIRRGARRESKGRLRCAVRWGSFGSFLPKGGSDRWSQRSNR